MSRKNALSLLSACALCAGGLAAHAQECVLSGDTSRPELSVFIKGEEAVLTFKAEGLKPNDSSLKLLLDIVDERNAKIESSSLPVAAGADGKWQGSVKAPSDKYGFYRVNAKLSNGAILAKPKLKSCSRPAGFITYSVVPDPASRTLYPDTETFFGMQGGFNNKVNVLPYLGIRWVLGGLGWNHMEPERPGQFDERIAKFKKGEANWQLDNWNWATYLRDGAKTPWKVYPLPCVYSTPKWAGEGDTNTKALKPEAEKAWSDYCLKMARHNAETHPEMNERLYQITWEPEYPWGFKGSADQIARIYELAYPAIHEGDLKAKVLGPTCGTTTNDWQMQLFKAGLLKYVDGVSEHPYCSDPERSGLIDQINSLKESIRDYCGKDLPLYGTEQGFPTGEKIENEIVQARTIVRQNLIMMGEGWKLNFAFYITDYPGEPGYGIFYNLTSTDFGADKTAPKPAVPAYAALTWLLEGHRVAGERIEWLGEGTLGYAYESIRNPEQLTLALWDYSGEGKTVSIPLGVPSATLFDWMGNATENVKTVDGALTLKLSEEPVYIRGASKDVWGAKAERPLKLASSRAKGFPGTDLVVKGAATAPNGSFVELELKTPSGETLMAKEKLWSLFSSKGFEIPLKIPSVFKPGKYPVSAKLLDAEGRTLFASGLLAEMQPPVASSGAKAVFDARAKVAGVKVDLKESRGKNAEGTLALNVKGIPESRKELSFKLGEGEAKSVELKAPGLDADPLKLYDAEFELKLSCGYSAKSKAKINFTPAPKLGASGWSAIPQMELSGRENVVRSPDYYDGDKDQSVKLRFAWDEKALHLNAEVDDDVFFQPYTGFNTWKGDCIQLGIDIDAEKPFEESGNQVADNASHRTSELDFALTSKGPEIYRTSSFDSKELPVDLLGKDEASLKVERKGAKTIYEAAIPWKALGLKEAPKAGSAIGIAASFNDLDDEKQLDPSALGCFTLKKPALFGKLTLLP